MHHTFRFAASRFAEPETLAIHLHERLAHAVAEADVAHPVVEDDASVVWLDIGGDRYRVAVTRDMAAQEPLWSVGIEHAEPAFVRRGAGHAHHSARFEALVSAVRGMILEDPTARLVAESDD
jgi:hypothetical protein